MSKYPTCPICRKDVKPRSDNPAFPFCTPRCKTIDLGRWMNEQYRVAVEDSNDEVEEAASTSKRDMRN